MDSQSPPKGKLHLWKLCNGIVAAKVNLNQKPVMTSVLCPFYLHNSETDSHVLKHCDFVVEVWNLVGLSEHQLGRGPGCWRLGSRYKQFAGRGFGVGNHGFGVVGDVEG